MEFNQTFNSWTQYSEEYPTSDGYVVPLSCCERFAENLKETCRKTPTSDEFKDDPVVGCWDKLEAAFNDNKSNILIVGVVIVVIMVTNSIFVFLHMTFFNDFSVAVPEHVVCLRNVYHGKLS